MHTHSFADYMRAIERDDWHTVGELMLSSAEKLAKGGADFLICPDNTIHQALPLMADESPLPWLHIAEEVAKVAEQEGFQKLALLGTKYLMEGPVYPPKLEERRIEFQIPNLQERIKINDVIFDELVNGQFLDESRAYFQNVIQRLKQEGCDAVVLGCTEIPLLIQEEDSPLPILDSTRLLARAALRYSL